MKLISIVIPIYNEEEMIEVLNCRLLQAMKSVTCNFEVLYVNDGSCDRSRELLNTCYKEDPYHVRVINLQKNVGQHMAILAGFTKARGDVMVTLDADLQNPPEEIPLVLKKYQEGFDYVGSYRRDRKDSFFRTYASKIMNRLRGHLSSIHMRDQGCMLRAYSRSIVDQIIQSRERDTFIPALAYHYASNPTDVEVAHEQRAFGDSKYHLGLLISVTFDLLTSFSLKPLHMISLVGLGGTLLSTFLLFLAICGCIFGINMGAGSFLQGLTLFMLSFLIFSVGIVGAYVGRIVQLSSHRPLFVVLDTFESDFGSDKPS